MQPNWINKFVEIYQAGISHSFIFHFNVSDYVSHESRVNPAKFLTQVMVNNGVEVVAIYSRDKGITFPVKTMETRFLEIVGIEQGGSTDNAALAALQSLGMAGNASDSELPRSPGEALPLLDRLMRYTNEEGRGSAIIIENAELICPDGPLASMSEGDRNTLAILSRWGKDSELMGLGNPVMLLTGNITNIHSSLREASNRYESIEIGLPDYGTRLAFIKDYISREPVKLAEDLTIEQVANSTAALSLLHCEDIFLRATAIGKLTWQLIKDRKENIVKSEFGDVLEIADPTTGFEAIFGVEKIKKFFLNSIIKPIKDGRLYRIPMGVLLAGSPGTGKTMIVKSVAKEAGVNLAYLRIGGQIASKWQGEGERNIDKALRAVGALSPCLVFIDELDQAISRGEDGNNQQDKRIFQRLLEFMADETHRGKVVFMGATNRVDLIDPAMKRPGRFDKIIGFFPPEREERAAIINGLKAQYDMLAGAKIDGSILDRTEGQTGADLKNMMVSALEIMEDEDLSPTQAIEEAARMARPTPGTEYMTLVTVRESDPRFLPERYQKMSEKPEELETRIKTTNEPRRGRDLKL